LLGELRARGRIVGRHHRVVGRQGPLRAILVRRHAVLRAQVPLERFELLPVFQTNEVFRRDRTLYWNSRFERLRRNGDLRAVRDAHQCRIYLADQSRNFGAGYRVVAHISGNNIGGQLDITGLIGMISHVGPSVSRIAAPPGANVYSQVWAVPAPIANDYKIEQPLW